MATTQQRKTSLTTIEHAVEIELPIEPVFDFVADSRNDPRWCPRVVSCDQLEGEGPGPGARYDAFHRPSLQRPHHRRIDVDEFDRPRRIRTLQEDDIALFTITYDLERVPRGTLLKQRDEIEWKIPRAYLPIAKRIVRRHIRDQLDGLKRLLETSPATSRAP